MAERHKKLLLDPDAPEAGSPVLREVAGAGHIPDVSLTLRLARERAGYEVKDVAQVLRIRAAHLEAIESGRFKDLPGPTYVTGFLRSYADFLGIDRDQIVNRYREEIGAAGRQKLSFPVPSYEGRMPRPWLILVALILVGLAYGGWHYYSTRDSGQREAVAEPPAEATMQAADAAADQRIPVAAEPSSASPEQPAIADAGAPSEAAADPVSDATAGAPDDSATTAASGGVGGSLFGGTDTAATTATATATDAASTVAAGSDAATAASEPSVTTDTLPPPATADGAATATNVTTSGNLWDNTGATTASSPAQSVAPGIEGEQGAELGAALAEDGDDFGASSVEPVRLGDEAAVAALDQEGEAATAGAPAQTAVAPLATASADSRVVITARADSWVQIQGPGNELVMTRILRPGESYAVPERPGLTMVTGNAGGLEVAVDGQPVGSLGAMGVVKRGIALDPDSLRATYGGAGQ
ncbi:MAG: helix-turn-helix domain-containing protein [Alphaproteobacteria bacterium]